MNNLIQKRLGYWMDEKQSKLMAGVEDALRKKNIEIVKIDLNGNLDDQGPFHGILHRLSDLLVMSTAESKYMTSNFESYYRRHPETIVLDRISRIRTLLDRYEMYSKITMSKFQNPDAVFIPAFGVLETNNKEQNARLIRLYKTAYPIVCKPIIADGSRMAHQMTIVFDEDGLSKCSFPCVIQSFINHNATLYKVYVIGDQSFVVVRSSLENQYAERGAEPIHFNNIDISKRTTAQTSAALGLGLGKENGPSIEVLRDISQALKRVLGLALFGVDVIYEAATGKCAIIDINIFPTYGGVPNFAEHLANFVRGELDKRGPSSANAN